MAKRKDKLKEMNKAALAHHTTYAELQKRETAEMIEPIRIPPEYKRAGDREAEKKKLTERLDELEEMIKPLEDGYKRTAAELMKG